MPRKISKKFQESVGDDDLAPNVRRAKSIFLRFIWIGFFLFSLSLCVYQVASSVLSYLNYDVISNLEINYENPAKFPSVVICNLNPYDGNYIRKEIKNIAENQRIASSNKTYFIEKINYLTQKLKSNFEKKWENDTNATYFYGFFLSQMLISCQFQNKPCFNANFSYYHSFQYGNCYSFNSGTNSAGKSIEIFDSKQPGEKFGLQLELFIGDPQLQQQYTYLSGIKVIVHNQSYDFFSEEDGVEVATGTNTNIAISRTFLNHLPLPYNDCIENLNDYIGKQNKILRLLKNVLNKTIYNQKYCLKICTQLFIIENCKCYDYGLPYIPDLRQDNTMMNGCFSNENFECLEDKYNRLFENFANTCDTKCPRQCNKVIFDRKISIANYPTEWYAKKIIENKGMGDSIETNNLSYTNLNFEYLKKTTLKLNVYYDELFYSSMTESPAFKIKDLIVFIGGNLGLFMGISLLSLIESLEIFFYVIYKIIKNKFSDKHNKVYDFDKNKF